MKRHFFNQLILFVIGIVLTIACLVACKKDKLTEPPYINKEECYDYKTNLVIQQIKRFDNQLKEVRNGTDRSNTYLDMDSVMWNIESLFNITYSFPEKKYVEKAIHELTFNIDTDNNMMSMSDVCLLYDEIVSSVREVYRNDGFLTNKGLMSIFLEKEESRSGTLAVKVIVVTGKTADYQEDHEFILYGPFDKDACWYYGEYGGSCDDPTILTDAAELLEDTINYIHGYKPEDNDYRNIYVNLLSVYLRGNEYKNPSGTDYYLFYKENCTMDDLYLDANELNEYYYAEVNVIKNRVPNDPNYSSYMPDDWVFMEVNIDGVSAYIDNNTQTFMHNNYIFYGSKYSVKKDEFGTRKNLLYN